MLFSLTVTLSAFSFDHRLHKPQLSTEFGERAFSYASLHAWNDLPDELRSTSNVATFKKHLKTHFFNSVFNYLVVLLLVNCFGFFWLLYCTTAWYYLSICALQACHDDDDDDDDADVAKRIQQNFCNCLAGDENISRQWQGERVPQTVSLPAQDRCSLQTTGKTRV